MVFQSGHDFANETPKRQFRINQWFFVAFPSLSDDKHQLGQVYSAAFWAESLCDGIHFCGSQCYPKATVEKMPLVI